MEKLIVLALAAVLLFTVSGVLAEEGAGAPLYATVGEAMEDSAEGRVVSGGVHGEYIAVVTRRDGKYYRSVAPYDEKLNELVEALDSLDYEADDFFEKHEAAMQAVEDYEKTLPIAYSEVFTAEPLTDAEMASMCGKTLAQLTEEGFEIGSNGTEPGEGDDPIIVFSLRFGVYDYNCTVDADFDRYVDAQDNGTEGELVVKDVALAGITEWGYNRMFHTDGTVEEPEDPFAGYGEILTEMTAFLEKVQAGEKLDIGELAAALKEKFPDYADTIDMYVTLYRTLGADGLASMLAPAEPAE